MTLAASPNFNSSKNETMADRIVVESVVNDGCIELGLCESLEVRRVEGTDETDCESMLI